MRMAVTKSRMVRLGMVTAVVQCPVALVFLLGRLYLLVLRLVSMLSGDMGK